MIVKSPPRARAGASMRASMLGMARAGAVALSALVLGGCLSETERHGFIFSDAQIQQIPIGASKEQVEFVLGTPSTTGSFDGDVYYYISQTSQQVAFMRPKIVDQRVLAVYFDYEQRVRRVADYGLQDGRVFDFVSRTTPTGGEELTLIRQILGGGARFSPF